MNKLILIIGIVLLISCGRAETIIDLKNTYEAETIIDEIESKIQSFSIVSASQEDYLKALKKYKDKLTTDITVIKKVNGALEVPIAYYPSSVIFTDTLIGIEELDLYRREYSYLGQYKNLGQYKDEDLGVFLVEGIFYEHYECYLIDGKSGRKTTIWNEPKLSPSSKYFANLSMPYGYEGIPNGIQVWKIDISYKVDLNKYLEIDQQIWAPVDFVWETDNALLLKVVSVDKFWTSDGEINDEDYYYLRINL